MEEELLKDAQDKNYIIFACGCGSRLRWRDHEGKAIPHSWFVTHDAHNNDNPDITIYHPVMGSLRLPPTSITKAIMYFNNIAFSGRTALYMVMRPGGYKGEGGETHPGVDFEDTLYTYHEREPKPPVSYIIVEKP